MTASARLAVVVANSSEGSSGVGPVVIAVGLTIGSVLLLSFLINRLPGSNENTGASPFRRRRGRRDPFERPPDDPSDGPPRTPFS